MNPEVAHFSVKNSTNDRSIIIETLLGLGLAAGIYLLCRGLADDDGLRVLAAVIGTAGWLYVAAALTYGRLAMAVVHLVVAALAFVLAAQALTQPLIYLPLGFALHALYAVIYLFLSKRRDAGGLLTIWAGGSGGLALLTAAIQ